MRIKLRKYAVSQGPTRLFVPSKDPLASVEISDHVDHLIKNISAVFSK